MADEKPIDDETVARVRKQVVAELHGQAGAVVDTGVPVTCSKCGHQGPVKINVPAELAKWFNERAEELYQPIRDALDAALGRDEAGHTDPVDLFTSLWDDVANVVYVKDEPAPTQTPSDAPSTAPAGDGEGTR